MQRNMLKVLLSQKVAVMPPTSLIFVFYLENKLQLALSELQTFKTSESSEGSGKYWITIKVWISKPVPSGSALSFKFAFVKQLSGFLQMLQHLFWVLRKNLSLFPPRPGCVSAPALLCSLPFGCVSLFSVPVISTCMWGAFSTEQVQVFSKGNIPSPTTGFLPPRVSSQHKEPGAASSAVQPFKRSTRYSKLQAD